MCLMYERQTERHTGNSINVLSSGGRGGRGGRGAEWYQQVDTDEGFLKLIKSDLYQITDTMQPKTSER